MHLGICRRDGDEEWGFKVSPKPQMMLLPHPSPADPGILPAPFTWKGVPAAAWARASPAPINLSLQISPFVCLSIRPSASLSCLGASLSPGLVQTGPSWEQPRGCSQWSSTAHSPSRTCNPAWGQKPFAGAGISLAVSPSLQSHSTCQSQSLLPPNHLPHPTEPS